MIGLNDSDVTSSPAPPSPPPSDLIVAETASRPTDTSPAEPQTISFLSESPVGPGGATPPEEEELDEWGEEEDEDLGSFNTLICSDALK